MEPEICKFLVDEGAEVDFVEIDSAGEDHPSVLERIRDSMTMLLISLACPGIL